MLAITVSPNFQVVIPQAEREQLHIEATEDLLVPSYVSNCTLKIKHTRLHESGDNYIDLFRAAGAKGKVNNLPN